MTSALVTGASAGIGLAVARVLGADGHAVTMVARREARLTAAADALRADGCTVEAVVGDVTTPGFAERMVTDHVARNGGLDLVVANAGRGTNGNVADASASDVDKMLGVNVAAPFALARAALPALRDSSGWFVITSSIAGVWPTAGSAAYSATKAAVLSLARSISTEEAAHGVRACAICPAFVDTAMTSWLDGRIAPQEMLDPNDVAEAVRFLLRLSPSAAITELVLRRTGAPSPDAP